MVNTKNSHAKTHREPAVERRGIADLNCRSVEFRFRVGLNKFRFNEFKRAFFGKSRKREIEEGVYFTAVLSTGNRETSDYHAHLSWYLTGRGLDISVEYYAMRRKPDPDEPEPFAEEAIPWLGRFFRSVRATAHTHVALEYPKSKWRSIVPFIPMTIALPFEGGPEMRLDGMSCELAKVPGGMSQAWLLDRERSLEVLLYGNRPIRFRAFNVREELADMSACTNILVREVSQ
jgi:hypothetical protein